MENAHKSFKAEDVNWLSVIEEIHDVAEDSGFWDMMDGVLGKMETVNKDHLKDYFDKKELIQVKKAFIAQKIMLIVSELSEAVEADRVSRMADWKEYSTVVKELRRENYRKGFIFTSAFEGCIKDTFEDEIADTIIRIFDLCKKMGIPIIKHIAYKIEYNKTRDRLHGKEY